MAPAAVDGRTAAEAIAIAEGVLEQLDVVGVLTVEFFVCRDGSLMVNELAPRPHNSGHLTIDAAVTSQFEQQVRAVCGLPLGSTAMPRPAAMVNLLGDVWANGTPSWPAALAAAGGVKLALVWQSRPATGPEDGPHHGHRRHRRRGAAGGEGGTGGAGSSRRLIGRTSRRPCPDDQPDDAAAAEHQPRRQGEPGHGRPESP